MNQSPVRAAAATLLCLAALSSASASADEGPRLPSGWSQGAAAPAKMGSLPRREFGSFQANHEFTFPVRNPVPGSQVDIEALPAVDIEAPAAASAASAAPAAPAAPAGSAVGDVIVLKGRGKPRVSLRGFEAGVISVGAVEDVAVGRQSEGGIVTTCGRGSGATGARELTYEAIRRVDAQGTIEFVWGRGSFITDDCRAVITERHTARPQHIGGGVVYAFRARCKGCEPSKSDVLHVLTPQMTQRFDKAIPFEHRKLTLAPGKSGAFEGGSSFRSPLGADGWTMPDWHGFIDRQCKKDSTWCFKHVRVEVSWGAGEGSPTLFVGGDVS